MSGRKKDNIISGNVSGGKAAAKTNKKRHGKNFYKDIGKLGGSVKGTKGGFASVCQCDIYSGEHLKARCSGAKGGLISRRGKGNSPEGKLSKGLATLGINLKEVGERYLSHAKNTKAQ